MTTSSEPPLTGRRAVLTGALGATTVALLAAACSPAVPAGRSQSPGPQTARATSATSGRGRKPLVVYFSRAGENYFNGGRTDLTVGNTAVLAGLISELLEVDLYEIRAADPYPDDYEATVRRNVEEQEADSRPAIADPLPDLAAYDTVLLGSGVWNVRAPMIMRTFVEAVDLTGKRVLPFVTYAVSGIGRVADEYARALPGAAVGGSLAVRGEEAADAGDEVEDWLRQNGLVP